MTARFVAAALEQGGDEAFRRLTCLKLMMLTDTLRERGSGAARLAEELAPALALAGQVPLAQLLRYTTPFLVFNVHRLYRAKSDRYSDLVPLGRYFLTHTFDSFFSILPDGAEIRLPEADAEDLYLPRLSLRIPSAGGDAVLRRANERRIEAEVGGETLTIDLDTVAESLRIRYLYIPRYDGIRLLLAQDPSLFHANYINRIEPETRAAPALSGMIADSLDLIRTVDPELGRGLVQLIRWYVPIGTPDLLTHNSFSASQLVGVIFLSEAYNDLRLAEAIVHEYHHNELHVLMEGSELLDDDPDQVYFSPWRPDPRPLYGLLHALHVFSGLLHFYTIGEGIADLAEHHELFRKRRTMICFQLRLGLAQIRERGLTEMGREMVDRIREEVDEQQDALRIRGEDFPRSMGWHMDEWRQSNPEVADRLVVP